MKVLVILAAFLAVCFAADLVHEEGRNGGPLFYRGSSGSHSSYSTSSQSKKVRYPLDGEYDNQIGYMKVNDDWDSDYSTLDVVGGGVGYNFVEFVFKAPGWRGYKYSVEIRGKKV